MDNIISLTTNLKSFVIANIINQIAMEYIKYDISDFYNAYTTQNKNIF